MHKQHDYQLNLQWTGNTGQGTSAYTAYQRSYTVFTDGKAPILGSSDPAFRGDPSRHNPEDLLLAAVSSCHLLWYLHLCADAGVIVLAYSDQATGTMTETPNGSGQFTAITLHPEVVVADAAMVATAQTLHEKANAMCFIANSLNFKVHHVSTCRVGTGNK
jgi:organic hydroperoxide reductase OsmC/OhrA